MDRLNQRTDSACLAGHGREIGNTHAENITRIRLVSSNIGKNIHIIHIFCLNTGIFAKRQMDSKPEHMGKGCIIKNTPKTSNQIRIARNDIKITSNIQGILNGIVRNIIPNGMPFSVQIREVDSRANGIIIATSAKIVAPHGFHWYTTTQSIVIKIILPSANRATEANKGLQGISGRLRFQKGSHGRSVRCNAGCVTRRGNRYKSHKTK